MRNAFSLVELSIVLVILGLLTGGILAGQSLIRASELRTISTQYQEFISSAESFRTKYSALPGDINYATEIWGRVGGGSGQCAAPETDTGTGTQTCNGNDNGVIGHNGPPEWESFRVWQHLSNAGLISGNYTGIHGAAFVHQSLIGINTPAGKISNSGWSFGAGFNYAGDSDTFAYNYKHLMVYGGGTPTDSTNAPIFKPEEVWNIDTKLDDGKPGTGKVMARYWDTCTTAAN